ncbi:ferritin-like domain-containing protein [Streptomyces sp. DSM 44915]|uniref:Ferritin-like domain-containing protein n=1 Tax=Streptomyces chisholmiae TaxID=3075540 RepID=A0ABU2JWA9_9ACTN|nr:ferritin-like domain-containing protein [Streptomyces sp. DSM 44915]MDT0269291.1 ferritin-like domain-containing protein [Streptomyces sp. DSM 44915]
MRRRETAPALDATQAALAAEHAAVYGYGLVGALLADEERGAWAREAYDAHRGHRDTLQVAVRELGASPVASAAGYALPFEVVDQAGAVRLAAELESRLAGAYADLVLAAEGNARAEAARALRDATVRAARWSGRVEPFPGLAEYGEESEGDD